MAPTRELVQQIGKDVKRFGKTLGINCVCVFGGSGIANQVCCQSFPHQRRALDGEPGVSFAAGEPTTASWLTVEQMVDDSITGFMMCMFCGSLPSQ